MQLTFDISDMDKSVFICRAICGYSDSINTGTTKADRMQSSVTDLCDAQQ